MNLRKDHYHTDPRSFPFCEPEPLDRVAQGGEAAVGARCFLSSSRDALAPRLLSARPPGQSGSQKHNTHFRKEGRRFSSPWAGPVCPSFSTREPALRPNDHETKPERRPRRPHPQGRSSKGACLLAQTTKWKYNFQQRMSRFPQR